MAQKIQELEEQFQQFEQSIGINDQNFANKFIFQQLRENLIKASAESNDKLQKFLDQAHTNLYLEISSKIQADLDGFTREEQNMLHFYGASIISDACQYLQLPITTCISAQTIFHRFYTKCSFLKHDIRDVAMGSVFIAGKAQETIKKPRDLAYVFDQIFKGKFIFMIYHHLHHLAKLKVLIYQTPSLNTFNENVAGVSQQD